MDEKQGSGGAYVCSTCSFRSEVFDAEGVRQSGAVFVPPSLFQGYLDNLRAVDSELSRPAARPWLPASFFFERGLLCVLNCMWPPKSLLAANSRRDCWGGQLGLPCQLLRFLRVIDWQASREPMADHQVAYPRASRTCVCGHLRDQLRGSHPRGKG